MGNNVKTTAGSVIAITTADGLIAIGLTPTWMYAVALIGLGLVTAKVAITVFR